jgi:hypothetical protein
LELAANFNYPYQSKIYLNFCNIKEIDNIVNTNHITMHVVTDLKEVVFSLIVVMISDTVWTETAVAIHAEVIGYIFLLIYMPLTLFEELGCQQRPQPSGQWSLVQLRFGTFKHAFRFGTSSRKKVV